MVKATLIWPTLSTQNPPRNQAQTSTRSRSRRTPLSPEVPTAGETSTPGRSPCPLGRSLATLRVEVTSVTGTWTTAATRPSPGPGRRQAAAATTPVMTATDPTMAVDTPPTATATNRRTSEAVRVHPPRWEQDAHETPVLHACGEPLSFSASFTNLDVFLSPLFDVQPPDPEPPLPRTGCSHLSRTQLARGAPRWPACAHGILHVDTDL
ncbi:glycoprotein Xg isoform X4 [Molossus molossus]|uniref:glycoprotein Xg isoform X4 n=1 Tax=Molossus molossus TaxID=27622 RepID=UPI0017460AEA|nr:glycoprotein Xg isoform X4 [Molossus molossus]